MDMRVTCQLCHTSFLNTQSVPATMVKEVVTIWKSSGRVTIRSVALRGGRVMTSRSTGSTPKLPGEQAQCTYFTHTLDKRG